MSQAPEDLNFSIDSRLLEELGENLVTRNHVAVAELIKNAYDADATQVDIEFINARQEDEGKESEIRIIDNGVGMTFEEIDQNWMRIGTTDKVRNPRTEKFGREKTGNKGIGRFSCRRLGYRLELTSVAEDPNSGQYIKSYVEFPWEEFARETDVDKIDVYGTTEKVDQEETGVTLRIMDLRDEWTQRDFDTLRRNVLMLSVVQQQRRDGYEEDPGFEIEFDAPEFEQGEGNLLEQVYNAGWCELNGKFTESGDVELSINAKKIGERSHTLRKSYSGLGGTDFKIAFIPKEKKYFRDPNTLSMERARQITGDYGGVRVYRDGFRVYPYGGPDDDWLSLDRYHSRRIGSPADEFEGMSDEMNYHEEFNRIMLLHPRNENLIGRISVATDADLKMKTDREGFIQNETFDDMKEGVRLGLQWLTLQYSNYQAVIEREKLEEKKEDFLEEVDNDGGGNSADDDSGSSSGLEAWNTDSSQKTSTGSTSSTSSSGPSSSTTTDAETVDKAVSVIQEASETVAEGTQGDEEISEVVEQASEIVQQSVEKNRKEIDFYRSAFSVNQFVFSFMHELREMILQLESARSNLDSTASSLSDPEASNIAAVADDVDELKERFEQQMNLFGLLTESGDDMQAEREPVEEAVDELVDSLMYISREYDIRIESDVPVNLYTPPMHRPELYSILVNLITNSIKAVIADAGDDKRILIHGTKEDDEVVLRVSDTGVGLPSNHEQDIMDPLISDPEGTLYDQLDEQMPPRLSSQLGSGTGLGLSIVSELANKYAGEFGFVDQEGWETTAEVRLSDE
jgi:signal transduction histidine kinase